MIVVGAHPLANPSMRRYTKLLCEAYERRGEFDGLIEPSSVISSRVPASMRKWARYLEQIPTAFRVRLISRAAPIHLADHSDAVFLAGAARPRSIVTCHDLIAVAAASGLLPEHKVGRMGRLYQRLVVSGLKNAGLIISVSHTTASDVARFTTRQSPVLLNPLAKTLSPSDSASTSPYLLAVSNTGWRKRRWLAIEAWLALRAASSQDLKLVIVGNGYDSREQELLNTLEPGLRDSIEIRRQLSDRDLANLYSSATLLLQLSKYEGFAWPIIEANSVGTLAVCADEPILRETGEGNFFIDANSLDRVPQSDWKNALRLAADTRLQATLRDRANSFSIDNFDRALSEILGAAPEGGR